MLYEVELEEDNLYEEDLTVKSRDDIYDEDYAEEAVENDQLTTNEVGFLRGYTKHRQEEDFWEIEDS